MPQRLGQHFLSDANWRGRILRALDAQPHDVWLEIGAGRGEMTAELAAHAQRVLAIELDARLLPQLRATAERLGNIAIISGDILAVDLRGALEASGANRPRVYGSLPYYITSPILRRLFQHAAALADVNVVIQREVAERLTAKPGTRDYGFLSVVTQFYTEPKIVLRIPPGAFRPPPRVESALVRLNMRHTAGAEGNLDAPHFLEFVGHCFARKRKTLANNLRGSFPVARIQAALLSQGLAADARAEQLSLGQLTALFKAIAAE